MEQVHLDNLAKLRDFLMTNKVQFDISDFRSYSDEAGNVEGTQLTLDEIEKGTKSCGTAGCAIGWAPFVVTPDPEHIQLEYSSRFNRTVQTVNMWDYTKDKFIPGETPGFRRVFDWPFGYEWRWHDNTREGAAYRIDVLIKTGEVPEFFNSYRLGSTADSKRIEWLAQYAKDRDTWIEQYRAPEAN